MAKVNGPILARAIRAASCSEIIRARVGAVVFTDTGNILTHACNCRLYGHKTLTIHAERSALAKIVKIRARERYGSINMLVVRVRANGTLSCAKPCQECEYYLREAGIKVWYTDNNGEVQRL